MILAISGCVSTSSSRDRAKLSQLEQTFLVWQGTPYQLGGSSHQGMDCSAFVARTYSDVFNLRLPRTTERQSDMGKRVSRSGLVAGDLVFFKTGWFQRHVGIYLENGVFMHASFSQGVTKSSIEEVYWDKRYWKAKRVIR